MKPKVMKIPGPFTVYLLHFHHAVDPHHYIGITTPQRLDGRMKEHAAGRGSATTAEACVLGLKWSLAATFETEDRNLEKKLASLRSAKTWCPICRGAPPIRNYQPTKMAPMQSWGPSETELYQSLHLAKGGPSKPMKKGTKPEPVPLSLLRGQT